MEEDAEETRENLRWAIRGAFDSLAEEDKGLQTHMAASYVEFYMTADHDSLSPQEQVSIIGLVHKTILQLLHANPSSLQMAHAHAYIHALAETYMPESGDDDDDDEEDQPDMLLEESKEDLDKWAAELAQYMEEKEAPDGEEGPPAEDTGSD